MASLYKKFSKSLAKIICSFVMMGTGSLCLFNAQGGRSEL